MDETFGIDQDRRQTIPIGERRQGVTGGQGIKDKKFNQLIYELRQDYIWGTSAQVTLGDANIYTDPDGLVFDKDDVDITANLQDDDVILMTHDATLAANLKIAPATAKRLKIGMVKGASVDFGDSGSGVPFKMILGSNIAKGSDIFVRGDFDFKENTLSDADKRLIANQARGVKIKYNEHMLFDPNNTGDIIYRDTKAANPYLIEYDGQQLDWLADASNTTKTWFRDLNVYLDGLVSNGSTFDETRSRFSLAAIPAYRFQVNTGFGFLRQISADDPDIHDRTDINGVSIADTAAFTTGGANDNVVTFTSITDIKNGMRINGASAQGIPDGSTGTTILKNVDTTAKTAEMIDALTGADVNSTATIGSIAVTMDNSGAAGGGQQTDAMQVITGTSGDNRIGDNSAMTGAFSGGAVSASTSQILAQTGNWLNFDNSLSTSPNTAKTSEEDTYPKSIGTIIYQRA